MEALKKFDLKKISIPKLIGVVVIGLVLFIVVVSLMGFAVRTAFPGLNPSSRSYDSVGYATTPSSYGTDGGYATQESAKLSIDNILPPTPGGDYTTGTDAESFEITEFNGYIRTGDLDRDCSLIESLKSYEYVIFENANRNDRNCDYVFKVKNEDVSGVLDVVKSLHPETLNENTHTIKRLVDDYSSEVEILEKKLDSVEETLLDAQKAYDEVEVLATRTQDVESLAKIIDSKIQLIERLTTERINIKEQIDRINKEKADQLDRLNFTFFRLTLVEDQIISIRDIKDSWVWQLKQVVTELSNMAQALTTGLLIFLFRAIPIAIYIIVALFVLKYGWRGAKYMWKK